MLILDPQMILNTVSQIRSIAEDMNQLNNVRLQNATDGVAAVWRGEAATLYLRHCATTRDQIRDTARELMNLANELESIARQAEPVEGGLRA